MINQSNQPQNTQIQQKGYIIQKEDSKQDEKKVLLMKKENFIWKGFPLKDRLLYSLFCNSKCMTNLKSALFPIDDILQNQSFTNQNMNFSEKVLFIKINKTGQLQIKPNIVHPYIKISFIDLNTLRYIQKSNFSVSSFVDKENKVVVKHNSQSNIIEFKDSEVDFLYPVATGLCDMRDKGEAYAEWNEPFIINEPAETIFQNSTMIFFELLDFNVDDVDVEMNESVNNMNYMKEIKNFHIPIAWGYIKPVGYSQIYLGKFKVQLYKHKYKRGKGFYMSDRLKGKAYQRTPDVLFEFNWIKREMYESYLEIELKLERKPNEVDLKNNEIYRTLWKYKLSAYYKEGDENFNLLSLKEEILKINKDDEINEIDDEKLNKNKYIQKIKKNEDEDCRLPNRLYCKFHSDRLGCLTLKFSPNGRLLACCCTGINSNTSIKIYNIIDKEIKFHYIGHTELIHSLEWSHDSRILISSGADYKVKLWFVPDVDYNNNKNLEFLENEDSFLLSCIDHPSYVYSTVILPNGKHKRREKGKEKFDNSYDLNKEEYSNSNENINLILIASACGDGYVRIYQIEAHENSNMMKLYNSIHSIKVFRTTEVYSYNIAVDFYEKDNKKYENFKGKVKKSNLKGDEDYQLLNNTILDKRFPNSLCVDYNGKLYAGDSLGTIHIWDIKLGEDKEILISKIKSITHRKLEGDDINNITINPTNQKKLLIHSRDNSIRLIDPFSKTGNIKIEQEYKGLLSQSTNIKSCISPDGNYVLSGSEQGTPKVWGLETGFPVNTDEYFECKFIDFVNDVSWNSQFNIIAICGFGHEYPILLYVYEKNDKEIEVENAVKMNSHMKRLQDIDYDEGRYNEKDRIISL